VARVAHHPLAALRRAAAKLPRLPSSRIGEEDRDVAKYRVLIGINYPDGQGGESRAEPGAVVDDLPEKAAKWMLRDGIIEQIGKAAKPAADEAEEAES
jgi:hypothetical protein